MRTPVKLLALELFDQELPQLQQAAKVLREHLPREGWVRSIRKSLGMSMRAFSRRIGFKEPASVKELERNERAGSITLDTLKRSEEHTSELQSQSNLVCRLLLEKKKTQ